MAVAAEAEQTDVVELVKGIGAQARAAAQALAQASPEAKNTALCAAAAAIRARASEIQAANEKDMAFGRDKDLSAAMLDRLLLTDARIEGMAAGLESVAELDDPVGTVLSSWERPNGLTIERVRVPLGVIGVIYESRPNVTADAGGLCLKSGNAAILRGGSESLNSAGVIADCLREGLRSAGLPEDAVQMIPTRDRAAVGALLAMHEHVDVIVPRGGRGLIERVMTDARMPVFAHLDGICHVYLHEAADAQKALDIAVNAKMRRTGICGAMETLLVDAKQAESFLPPILEALFDQGCEVRGDAVVQGLDKRVQPVEEADWRTEYGDAILSVRTVSSLPEAVEHINTYGSHHTDSIVTEDAAAAEAFLNQVDSAICMHNASTQFADGGEFGMGAEIGISTGRMHARGPVGADQLTIFKYRVRGTGQTRP